jgi:hypothetical protein
MKEDIPKLLRGHLAELSGLQKSFKATKSARINQHNLKAAATAAARRWFDEVKPALEAIHFTPDYISESSKRFEDLLRFTSGYTTKQTYIRLLVNVTSSYNSELIHQIEIAPISTKSKLSIAPYLEGLPTDEGDYLDEAQRCLTVEALRACIVLGWCATISRIHEKICTIGFPTFNKASEEMASKNFGRFKPFTKKFSIESQSELQRIFDTDLLWVLEYLQLIDSNQHQRLRYCFDLRNHSAHPGLAPIAGENLYAFFFDITKIVLKNPKFEVIKSLV